MIDWHESFKKSNGYSELEISQKRTALEGVLKPDTMLQLENYLKSAGFEEIDTWFKQYNFCSIIAIKS
jgi:tRNA (cmo5U34)-methyltransferase